MDEAHAHWSRLHGGLDPTTSVWVSGWVRLVHRIARPLSRRGVSPDTVTLAGVAVTVPVPLVASLGGGWPLLATVLLVVAAVLDGVDGAVAAQTGTDSAWGRVLDPLADRIGDVLLVVVLVVLGAPLWLGALLVVVTLLHESVRATAQVAGLPDAGVVTVAERPTRVIVAAFGTGIAGVAALVGPVDPSTVATVAVAVGLALALAGMAQLLVVVRRVLGD